MTSVAQPVRSAWRFYPWFVAGALGFVIAVNMVMVTLALSTFPGVAEVDQAAVHVAQPKPATAPK